MKDCQTQIANIDWLSDNQSDCQCKSFNLFSCCCEILTTQIAASMAPDSAAVVTRNVVALIGKSYLNVVNSKALNDERLKIGGAIRVNQKQRVDLYMQWPSPTSFGC